MKKRPMFLFSSVFLLSFLFTSFVSASLSSCSVSSGSSSSCDNDISVQDNLARFTHKLTDFYRAPDSYSIYFSSSRSNPSVGRGDPIYKNFYIYDSFNRDVIYQKDDYWGDHLADYILRQFATEVTAGYYPDKSAQTHMNIQNAPPVTCAGQFWDCASYEQANVISIK